MATKEIYVEPLQKRFVVSTKNANRSQRNKSYPNASNCCGARVRMKKYCDSCGDDVGWNDSTRKIVKVGKEEHLVDANALKQVSEQLEEMEDVTLHTFLSGEPEGAEDRYDDLLYATPAEKKESDYAELREILKGRVAIGKGVFRNNEYQVVVKVGNDGVLRIRKLVDAAQRYDFSPAAVQEKLEGKMPNAEIVALERQILDKKATDSYDLDQFRDTRAEYEEEVIEEFVLHGRTPEVKPKVNVEKQENELERLKALAES